MVEAKFLLGALEAFLDGPAQAGRTGQFGEPGAGWREHQAVGARVGVASAAADQQPALEAGIEHIVFVTGRNKSAIEDYFDLQPELNDTLSRSGKSALLAELDALYRRLGVQFDYTLGESFYHDRLPDLVDELLQRGIARESEGAICIFLDGFEAPMIIRKKDGAFLYATTDLATLVYRVNTWHPDCILYVVDHRQSLHFRQLFTAANLLGYKALQLEHVSFGTILGEDGRPFRTRAGDTVALEDLLEEAVRRAREVVDANDDAKPERSPLGMGLALSTTGSQDYRMEYGYRSYGALGSVHAISIGMDF